MDAVQRGPGHLHKAMSRMNANCSCSSQADSAQVRPPRNLQICNSIKQKARCGKSKTKSVPESPKAENGAAPDPGRVFECIAAACLVRLRPAQGRRRRIALQFRMHHLKSCVGVRCQAARQRAATLVVVQSALGRQSLASEHHGPAPSGHVPWRAC